jgi:hypothetical protein
LLLVDELSVSWGVETTPDGAGKVVWCVMAPEPGPPSPDRSSLAAEAEATALLLGVPVRYLVAHERRVDAVVRALQAGDAAVQHGYGSLVEEIHQAQSRHAHARVHRPVDVEQSSLTDRIDVAFDSAVNPYRSAVELAESLDLAESLIGRMAPAAGLSIEDMAAFDQWYVDELGRQVTGEAPLPCPFPARIPLEAL